MLEKFGLQTEHQQDDDLHFRILNTKLEEVYTYEYLPEKLMLINTWKTYITTEEFKIIYQYIGYYNYTNQFPVICSITDMQDFDGSFEPMSKWFLEEYMPKAVQAGFRANANIKSKDFYTQLSTQDINERIRGLFLRKDFDTKEEAMAWLDSKPWQAAKDPKVKD